MSVITAGTTFSNGEQLTADKLNLMIRNATFDNSAVDLTSTFVDSNGAIVVRDSGITEAKIASNAVTTNKIANSNVTKAKIENVADMKVLGNTSGSATAPQEVSILDEDDMASDSATSLATQQSIKAYVDSKTPSPSYVAISGHSSLNVTNTNTTTTSYTYAIADFTGTGFDSSKVTGFYITIFAEVRRIGSRTTADVKATFPDGTDIVLLGHAADSPEDQTTQSRGTVFCPVAVGQANLVIKPTLSGDTRTTSFTIVGCTQM